MHVVGSSALGSSSPQVPPASVMMRQTIRSVSLAILSGTPPTISAAMIAATTSSTPM